MPARPSHNTNWTWRQQEYIAWLALPKSHREPPTQRELADVLGVNRRTLIRWKKLPGFIAEVQKLADLHIGEQLADVLQAMVDAVTEDRDTSAARVILETLGRIGDAAAVQQYFQSHELTIEQYHQAKRELEEWRNDQGDGAD